MANSEEQISPTDVKRALLGIFDRLEVYASCLRGISDSVRTIAHQTRAHVELDSIRSEAQRVEDKMRDVVEKLSQEPSYTQLVRKMKEN
jgi:hypothetical protein